MLRVLLLLLLFHTSPLASQEGGPDTGTATTEASKDPGKGAASEWVASIPRVPSSDGNKTDESSGHSPAAEANDTNKVSDADNAIEPSETSKRSDATQKSIEQPASSNTSGNGSETTNSSSGVETVTATSPDAVKIANGTSNNTHSDGNSTEIAKPASDDTSKKQEEIQSNSSLSTDVGEAKTPSENASPSTPAFSANFATTEKVSTAVEIHDPNEKSSNGSFNTSDTSNGPHSASDKSNIEEEPNRSSTIGSTNVEEPVENSTTETNSSAERTVSNQTDASTTPPTIAKLSTPESIPSPSTVGPNPSETSNSTAAPGNQSQVEGSSPATPNAKEQEGTSSPLGELKISGSTGNIMNDAPTEAQDSNTTDIPDGRTSEVENTTKVSNASNTSSTPPSVPTTYGQPTGLASGTQAMSTTEHSNNTTSSLVSVTEPSYSTSVNNSNSENATSTPVTTFGSINHTSTGPITENPALNTSDIVTSASTSSRAPNSTTSSTTETPDLNDFPSKPENTSSTQNNLHINATLSTSVPSTTTSEPGSGGILNTSTSGSVAKPVGTETPEVPTTRANASGDGSMNENIVSDNAQESSPSPLKLDVQHQLYLVAGILGSVCLVLFLLLLYLIGTVCRLQSRIRIPVAPYRSGRPTIQPGEELALRGFHQYNGSTQNGRETSYRADHVEDDDSAALEPDCEPRFTRPQYRGFDNMAYDQDGRGVVTRKTFSASPDKVRSAEVEVISSDEPEVVVCCGEMALSNEDLERNMYIIAGVLGGADLILFIIVLSLLVSLRKLKSELRSNEKSTFKRVYSTATINSAPGIQPGEELANRGFQQYPERPTAALKVPPGPMDNIPSYARQQHPARQSDSYYY